jgi:hypothetical protein
VSSPGDQLNRVTARPAPPLPPPSRPWRRRRRPSPRRSGACSAAAQRSAAADGAAEVAPAVGTELIPHPTCLVVQASGTPSQERGPAGEGADCRARGTRQGPGCRRHRIQPRRAAGHARSRPGHRGTAAGQRGRQPRPHADRSLLRRPLRSRPGPRLQRQHKPPPPLTGRRPGSQRRPLPHRPRPHVQRSRHPCIRGGADHGWADHEGDHQAPQTSHRESLREERIEAQAEFDDGEPGGFEAPAVLGEGGAPAIQPT